jgi:hypothetical protein
MKHEEYSIFGNNFEYNDKTYDCSHAIKRDIRMILQEAEETHKDSLDILYDRHSLNADKVRIFLDEKDNPIFGMVLYIIKYKDGSWARCACGGYFPFYTDQLVPHPYQESICW